MKQNHLNATDRVGEVNGKFRPACTCGWVALTDDYEDGYFGACIAFTQHQAAEDATAHREGSVRAVSAGLPGLGKRR